MSALAKALVDAQLAMPGVKADSKNPHYKSEFVSLDHLIAETRPILNLHGIAIVQEPTVTELGAPALRTTLVHASGEERTSVMPLLLAGSDMQKLGAAITYARRYAWTSALGISEEDDDGHTASATTKKTVEPSLSTAPAPQPASGAPTADLEAEHDTLARTWGKLEGGFSVAGAIRKRAEVKKDAQANADAAPYRKWLGEQIASYKQLIGERNAVDAAQESFPIPSGARA